MIGAVLAAGAGAFACTLLLTPVVRALARRLGAVDRPGGERKRQQAPVPVGGGVGIFIGYAAGLGLACALTRSWGVLRETSVLPVFLASVIILAVGTVDDLRNLSPWPKLAANIKMSASAKNFVNRRKFICILLFLIISPIGFDTDWLR